MQSWFSPSDRSHGRGWGSRLAAVIWIALLPAAAGLATSGSQSPITHPRFNPDGTLQLPVGYRRWEHVGTRIKPDGRSVLDGSQIVTPQVMDTYIEPSAFAAFMRTGHWPDGTRIVKEISEVEAGAQCNATTFVCATPFGSGIFQSGYLGIGMMVKDSRRFAHEPGNWGYFRFARSAGARQGNSPLLAHDQCEYCHEKSAADTDYVFSRSHIGLRTENRY